jgi:hypothetical protein
MKQTAVEWNSQQHLKLLIKLKNKELSIGEYAVQYQEILHQAKEMEKQQIVDAFQQGHEEGYHFNGSVSDYESEGLEKYLAQQYYNGKFNK